MLQDKLDGRTILVTGASGFIGSHLTFRLLTTSARVVGLDKLNAYYDPRLKEYRLGLIEDAARLSSGSWQFVHGDLADRELVNRVFHEEMPSIIVNLAARIRYLSGESYAKKAPEKVFLGRQCR